MLDLLISFIPQTLIAWFVLFLGVSSGFHFVCVANGLPRMGATLKIRLAVMGAVFASGSFMATAWCPAYMQACALLLIACFLIYEIAKWRDGVLLCEHYSKGRER